VNIFIELHLRREISHIAFNIDGGLS